MTKQVINVGATANDKKGDSLRAAFQKVNANFTELYTALGLNSDPTLNLGSFEFVGSTISTTDSSAIVIDQATTITSNLTVNSDILPGTANNSDLGSLSKPWRSLYVSNNTVYLGGTPLSIDAESNELRVNNIPVSQTITYTDIPNVPTDIADLTDLTGLLGSGGGGNQLVSIQDNNTFTITNDGDVVFSGEVGGRNRGLVWDYGVVVGGVNSTVRQDQNGLTVRAWTEVGMGLYSAPVNIVTNQDANERVWQFNGDGDLTLPAGGDIKDSQGNSVLGGAAGPVQPYLELTNTPFITQPVVLGTPVTVTVPVSGINALVQVDILEGPVLSGITVITPGTGYVPGQSYIIYSYQIGGSNDATDSITFTIDTVNGTGGILTVANAAFTGVATNNPASYSVSIDYQPATVIDQIGPGLSLTRDLNQGIYNSALELEYDNNTYLSPLGTEWNSEGWGDLLGLGTRSYTTWRQALNNQVGNNIVASELVMHDIANDKYYKFDFTAWGGSNGGYSYTRTEVTDPNYFKKADYATANNVDVIEDDSTLQIGITRDGNNGIYNPFTEEGWNSNVSPQGTLWNINGWSNLSDVETRTYTNLYAAFGNGGLGNKIVGTECVMYVPSIEKYYAVKFLSWTQNNQGGGFSYVRYEIDLTKLNEGITFADGSQLKSAEGVGRIKSTAAGNRRIEEVTGYNEVAVTSRVTNNYAGLTSQTTNGYELRVARTPELDAVILPINQGSVNATFTLSYDNITYRAVWLSSVQQTEYWFYYEQDFGQTTPQTQGDAVYLTVTTGADPVVWWSKNDLPGGSQYFRGAVIDYHAYTGDSTIIGTIHIVDDDGEEHISHQEVQSGSPDGENDDLWLVTSEGQIRYRRIDGESSTLKVHWTAKVFYGSELYD